MSLETLTTQLVHAEKPQQPEGDFNEYLDERFGNGTSRTLEMLLTEEINLQLPDPYNARALLAADSIIIFGRANFANPDDQPKILASLEHVLVSNLYKGQGYDKSFRTAPFERAYFVLAGAKPKVDRLAKARQKLIKKDLEKEVSRRLKSNEYGRAGDYAATYKLLYNKQIGSEDTVKMIQTIEAESKPYVKDLGINPYSTSAVSRGAATLRILKAAEIKPIRNNEFRRIEIS